MKIVNNNPPPENNTEYNCSATSKTKALPIDRMKNYIKETVAKGPPADGQLW